MEQITRFSITPPIFDRVHVDYLVVGGTRVSWELYRTFNEPLPYTFQLQVAHTGLSTDLINTGIVSRVDDWENVGSPVVDTFFAIDDTKRLFGKTADIHYRVKLVTGLGQIFYSNPINVYGDLEKHDWLTVKELIRKERLRHVKQTSVRGVLLKAKRYGPLCTDCTDPMTQEVVDSKCVTCYGTGFLGGYFLGLPDVYMDISQEKSREALNPQLGTTKEVVVRARTLAEPQIYALDIWAADKSDQRYYVHPVSVAAQHRGVPVIINVELRLAPYNDVAYIIPLEP